MTQGARQVPFQDVCIQVFILATSNRFDKIRVVMLVTTPFIFDTGRLSSHIQDNAAAIAGDNHNSLGTVENHADTGVDGFLRSVLFIFISVLSGFQSTDFKHQLFSVRKAMNGYLSVCGFTGVFVAESAPITLDRVADRCFAETPARDIHLMNPLVAQVAVAVIPHPVPIVMQ